MEEEITPKRLDKETEKEYLIRSMKLYFKKSIEEDFHKNKSDVTLKILLNLNIREIFKILEEISEIQAFEEFDIRDFSDSCSASYNMEAMRKDYYMTITDESYMLVSSKYLTTLELDAY